MTLVLSAYYDAIIHMLMHQGRPDRLIFTQDGLHQPVQGQLWLGCHYYWPDY
ncbi:hypothetical protein [Snodgrassella communis]|uniref:Uncharacterized protein n=1 Tax=Snodgrassella communis TaxID=2946699 RepID=A0A836MQ55_9NEIS|nr:hypothetical protein [Snodgrassella communis]KDN14218.1 hypothetical protein SALWKB29_1708 [Snodgrassella communis]